MLCVRCAVDVLYQALSLCSLVRFIKDVNKIYKTYVWTHLLYTGIVHSKHVNFGLN